MEHLTDYTNYINSEIPKASFPEKLVYERICRNIIENTHCFNEGKYPDLFQRTFSEFIYGQPAKVFVSLYRKAVLESFNSGYLPISATVLFYMPEPNSIESKQLITNALNELSEMSSTLAVPVISASARFFSNPDNSAFLTISILSEKQKELQANSVHDLLLFARINLHSSEINTAGFQYKLLKEAQYELIKIQAVNTFYSGNDLAALVASMLMGTQYKGALDLTKFAPKDVSFSSALCSSVGEGFIAQFPEKYYSNIVALCTKWGLGTQLIGEIIENEPNILSFNAEEKIRIDANVAQSIIASMSKSATLPNQNKQIKLKELPQENKFLRDIATRIISRPNVASKRWIKYQFERFAGGNNLSANLHSETPLIVFQGNSLVSLSHHANPQFFEEQFEFGFKRAFLTTLSKVVATGAIPTSCHICFMVPVSFNDFGYIKDWATAEVSMYNLPCHISFNILPGFKLSKIQCIPVISIMGQVNDKMKMQGYAFTHKGDMVFLLGETHKSLSEEYMQELYCQNEVISESINLSGESSILDHISMLIKNTLVNSVHAVSQNGLYAALVESCIPGRFGADITTDSELRNDLFLFGSVGVRFVVSVAPNKEDQFLNYLLENNILFTTLGHVTKEELRIDDISYGFISDIRKKYLKSLGDRFK